uniref:Septin-type G domain-containing protein n=1 Tax=Angiostrongylus cantonensis TaxID=6313 RepID=A0A0K0D0M4_ANGCA
MVENLRSQTSYGVIQGNHFTLPLSDMFHPFLKALDLVTLRELAKRVNVIPVIAKSDTTCKDELIRFKNKIISELRSHKIEIYQFPTDDETVVASLGRFFFIEKHHYKNAILQVAKTNAEMNSAVPFAVVGSCDFVKKENGMRVRARRYPWGIVEVENEQHCDFVKLREALIRTNVDALRERTHNVLYENYRRDRLRGMHMGDGDTGPKMVEKFNLVSIKCIRSRYLPNSLSFLLNVRSREVEDRAAQELRRLDLEIRALQDERTRLLAKAAKKLRR